MPDHRLERTRAADAFEVFLHAQRVRVGQSARRTLRRVTLARNRATRVRDLTPLYDLATRGQVRGLSGPKLPGSP